MDIIIREKAFSRLSVVCVTAALVFFICGCRAKEKPSGQKLARSYCGSCHMFPEPSLLNKYTWEKQVLPKMSEYLGLAHYDGDYYLNATLEGKNVKQSAISINDWHKIVRFYVSSAPSTMAGQGRSPVSQVTDRFMVWEGIIKGSVPSTTFLKVDPGYHRIYVFNAYDSLFTVFNKDGKILQKENIHKTVVDVYFQNDLRLPGKRSGVITNIGVIYPNDAKTGSLEAFQMRQDKLTLHTTISDTLPRPVQTIITDFGKDGHRDYLICGFGNQNGAFYYLHSKDGIGYEEKKIRPLAGAIKAYVEDYNKDGLPDIIGLFAQADEGVLLFLNKGNGKFETKELLRFPPVYGSSYFEMQDVNADGLKDIVYTCGDNLDYSKILKSYHGVYIFLNKGNDKFEQCYFFPINGCYKAVARDFDKDGDIDIATISYFPDSKNQPEESFVYLENKGAFNFAPYTIKQFNRGNWLTMDADDLDGDGDDDIVIGSMEVENTGGQISITKSKGDKPAFLLLKNTTH